jgi:hypothetical protein
MATATPQIPLQLGQLVRRRFDPVDLPFVGTVGGLIFGNPDLAIVRWEGAPWTFELERRSQGRSPHAAGRRRRLVPPPRPARSAGASPAPGEVWAARPARSCRPTRAW